MESQNKESSNNQNYVPSNTVNLVSSTSNGSQPNARVPKSRGHRSRKGFNRKPQSNTSPTPSIIGNQSSTTSQSRPGAKTEYSGPQATNARNTVPIVNHNTIKHTNKPANGNLNWQHQPTSTHGATNKQIGPQSKNTNMSGKHDRRHRSTSIQGAIKEKIKPQFKRIDRNYAVGERAQERAHPPANQQRHNARNGGGKRRCVGFKYLDDLLKLDEEEFVLKISENMLRLSEFVDQINLTNDTYVLIVSLLKKIFDSRFTDSQQALLKTILKERLIDNLQRYLGSLLMHDLEQKLHNKYFWKDPNAFWATLIDVSRKALEILPNYASNVLPKVVKALQICIPSFEEHQKEHVPDEIIKDLDELVKILEATKLRFPEESVAISAHLKTGRTLIFENEEPPDDFRTISVYPDVFEILSDRSFVRPNVIDGPYKNVDHYLDVQFRLLREDFVNPLRSGVRSIQSGKTKRHENVRVYKKVRFLHQETVNEYHCIRLRFDFTKKLLNFKYENSKKFMFGTLLCFTRDNFATLKFARVVEREKEDLKKGELVVGFNIPEPDISFNDDYLMIECSVYFEPYFHVLRALQTIHENDFAMAEYIVNVQPGNDMPKYLDLRVTYQIDGRHISINDLMSTTANFYGFNDSQMHAYRGALTREFALIQGPPGTGKTFLGLRIAKTLLENHNVWWNSTPMLVICFTNHALDQFLEGLLDTTRNIVRIGGQSKNERLNELNLRAARQKDTGRRSYISRNQVRDALTALGSATAKIKEIEEYAGIVSYQCFYEAIPGFDQIFSRTSGAMYFLEWLLEGYQEKYHTKEETKHNGNIGENENVNSLNEETDFMERDSIDDDENANQNHESLAETLCANIHLPQSRSEIKLADMYKRMDELKLQLHTMRYATEMSGTSILELPYEFLEIENTARILVELDAQCRYLRRRLEEVRDSIVNQRIRTDINTWNLALIPCDDRWVLYAYWLNTYKQQLQEKAVELTHQFQGLYKQYEEVQNLEDTRMLRANLVVGMTTTSAARLRSVLQGLCSPIVIVEEAAEVLEAHIITALTKHCQHLILIGDHKQLKPSSADYKITKDYKLGISLFERLVNNDIQCYTLNVQHRMRPEISRLVCPTIYPDLKDHESVLNRVPIAGIDTCLRFVDHSHMENDCGDNPTKKNLHEVKFALALARYIILNGYKSDQVTILAAYLGQMFEMSKERERDRYASILKNVRIAALDNYQGEESDIIILSLVRSNTANRIGFLAVENRVCVALSRAKYGFYIIGNMGMLSGTSKIWREINSTLKLQNAIGPDLTLRCQIHPNIRTLVSKSEDFERVLEGGCNQICKALLICGHLCRSLCHIQNREHEKYKCFERCNKNLCDKNVDHICRKMCYEKCGICIYEVSRVLPCGHEIAMQCHIDPDTYKCPILVTTILPCDHTVEKPCHADAATFVCKMPCEVTVDPCGHTCTRNCHIRNDPDHMEYKCPKKCARSRVGCTMKTDSKHLCNKFCYESCPPCNIAIKKQRSKCLHVDVVACCEDVDFIACSKPCATVLSCGHVCKKKCNEFCSSSSCIVKVKKILPICKHSVLSCCNEEPNRNLCDKRCPLKLPCGHPCTQRCNQACTKQCQMLVDCPLTAACGHLIQKMKCYDLTSGVAMDDRKLLANCSYPCNVKLKCGHQCSGTCGECMQGRFHKRCSEKCGVPLVCNHECSFPCREACRPCNQRCTYRCVHSVCNKKCGEICTPCKEPCQRRCEHQECSQFCSSICDVPPCIQPCSKLRVCGHACIGFCGEPCPPKCLVCDREELLEVLFGYEDENSRFVLLLDCNHVIESEGMEQWLKMGDNSTAIGIKVCPKCKTPIKKTLRYSDHIKHAIADVNKVKVKAAGSANEVEAMRQDLIEKTQNLRDHLSTSIWGSFLNKLQERLKPAHGNRRQNVNMIQLTAISAKLQVLEQISEIFENPEEKDFYRQGQQEIHSVLNRDVDYATNQEIADIARELRRLLRGVQYERLKRSSHFDYRVKTDADTKRLSEDINAALCLAGPYSDDERHKSLLEQLKKILGSPGVLHEVEKREIVKAMGMERGHWFKCPNGHVYAIGECGGAMEVAKCNECGAKIGGTSHALLAGNSLASEMDGARYAAYSEMANNMGNFINL